MTAPQAPQVIDESPDARRREQRGWYWYDWANSAFPTTVLTVFLGPYLTDIAERAAEVRGSDFVDVLGFDVRPAAYYGFVVGAAAICQIVFMPMAGAIADHTGRKRGMLGLFAYLGAAATLAMWFVADTRYLLGGALFIVANIGFACAMVIYNSFLPQIASADERDRVSSLGWGFGYLGGGLLLLINLALYLQREQLGIETSVAVRISLVSAGLWWGGFTIIPLLRLRNRPVTTHDATLGQAVGGSFRQLGRTLRDLRRYPLTLLFLGAYLLYNDGVQSVIAFSGQFASEALKLDEEVRIAAILIVQFVAFGGALLLGRLAIRYGTKRVVLYSLIGWVGVLGLAYIVQEGSALQFLGLGVLIAIVLGGTQALSRSLFSHVIPKGKEAEYYSLYEISDKGSTFLGAWTFGLVLQLTDSDYRVAIISLLIFFALGFGLLLAVDLPRAIREAGNEVPDKI
ncbi:MFS transporter [Acrocarpospora sp. B8E8]|uniref:MFS transporter n=1 Tax=Acrocarpospora sp. B8E8 TaxID=3153572 RepID=UPI00325E9765